MNLYVIRNSVDGREYVGTTTQTIAIRMSGHRGAAFRLLKSQPLYVAIREIGWSQFEVSVIATTDNYEELLRLEQRAILDRNTLFPFGYNLVKGGRGNYGWRPSETTRSRIAEKARGRTAWNKGVPATPEMKAKTSIACKGKHSGQEPWNRGVRATPETRAKLSAMRFKTHWHRKPVEINGVRYESQCAAARESGLTLMQVRYRITKGQATSL